MLFGLLKALLLCCAAVAASGTYRVKRSAHLTTSWPSLPASHSVDGHQQNGFLQNAAGAGGFDGILPGTQRVSQAFSGFLSGGHTASGFDLETFTKNAAVETNRKKTMDMASLFESRLHGGPPPSDFFAEPTSFGSSPTSSVTDPSRGVRVLPTGGARSVGPPFDFALPDDRWKRPFRPPVTALPRNAFFEGSANGIGLHGEGGDGFTIRESRFGFAAPNDVFVSLPTVNNFSERNLLKSPHSNLLPEDEDFEREFFEEAPSGRRTAVNTSPDAFVSQRETFSGLPFVFPIGRRPATKTVRFLNRGPSDAFASVEPRVRSPFSRKRSQMDELSNSVILDSSDSDDLLNEKFEGFSANS